MNDKTEQIALRIFRFLLIAGIAIHIFYSHVDTRPSEDFFVWSLGVLSGFYCTVELIFFFVSIKH